MKAETFDLAFFTSALVPYSGGAPITVPYCNLPMSVDALRAALAPWAAEGPGLQYRDVPRQLLVDLGVIREE